MIKKQTHYYKPAGGASFDTVTLSAARVSEPTP